MAYKLLIHLRWGERAEHVPGGGGGGRGMGEISVRHCFIRKKYLFNEGGRLEGEGGGGGLAMRGILNRERSAPCGHLIKVNIS